MSDWKGICIVAVVMAVIAEVVRTVEAILTMGFYTNPAYFSVWSPLMMPAAGPPPVSFYIYSLVFGLVAWGLFAFVYGKLGSAMKTKDATANGLKFGTLVFLLAGLPGTMAMYLMINLPVGLLVSWTISGLILYLAGGVVSAKFVKPE